MIITGDSVIKWVAERIKDSNFTISSASAIGLINDCTIVAGVVYDGYNGCNICMHIASDGSKKWLNREFLWYAFYYPFVEIGVKRITGIVPSCNKEAISFDEKIGFEIEATLKDAHPDGDLIIYKMTKSKCRWLTLKG